MLHPHFRSIPDRYTAEAFSEVLIPRAYKYAYSLAGTPFTVAHGFPPEPAYIASMTAAFLSPVGDVRRFAVHGLASERNSPSEKQLFDAYDKDVTKLQDRAEEMEPFTHFLGMEASHPLFGRLGRWVMDVTIMSGQRLIAAHLVYRAVKGGRIHSALAYPTAVKEAFPLALALDGGAGSETLKSEEVPSELRESLGLIMRNEVQVIAGVPAAAVMPLPETFRTTVREHRRARRGTPWPRSAD